MRLLLEDLRLAARLLGHRPGFSGLAVLTLAIGLGAATLIGGVVDAVVFRSLPYPEPERVVRVWPGTWFTKAELLELRRHTHAYGPLAAYFAWGAATLTGDGPPVQLRAGQVSAEFFEVLGVAPILGRGFDAGEDQPGSEATVVLSEGLWRSRFGASPQILGTRVVLAGRPRTVVGVMPERLRFPLNDTELWLPLVFDPADATDFGSNYLQLVGRLAPGVSLGEARAEAPILAAALRRVFGLPTTYGEGAGVEPLRHALVGDVRPALLALLGAVACVLLIAAVNVANLLLARGVERQREFAVRLALGASPWRLARLVLVESALVAVAGGLLAVAAAWGLMQALRPLLPAELPRLHEIGFDARLLGLAALAVVASALVAGLVPAARAIRSDAQPALREGGPRLAGAGGRLRGGLVVAQVTLAVVLAVGAGLLARSLWRLAHVDLGLGVAHVVSFRPGLPDAVHEDPVRMRTAYEAILERVGAVPGVERAAAIHMVPIANQGYGGAFQPEGWPEQAEPPFVNWRVVTPGYFETVSVPLRRGRPLDGRDREGTPAVAVVNEALARRFWPGRDAVGQRFRHGLEPGLTVTVVGVVGDVHQHGAAARVRPEVYRPLRQVRRPVGLALVVRTRVAPAAILPAIRAAVWSVDPNVPLGETRWLAEVVARSLAQPRLVAGLMAALAGLALALGAVGTYGVLAGEVGARTREIGVRMALGARRGQVLRHVLARSLRRVLLGLVLGIPLALALARLLRSELFEVGAADPATYAAVVLLLLLVGALAALVPARRAAGIEPLAALRHE